MEFSSLLRSSSAFAVLAVVCLAAAYPSAHAAERVTLKNGAEFDCVRQEANGDRIRLYLVPSLASPSAGAAPTTVPSPPVAEEESYVEISAASVLRVDFIPASPRAAGSPASIPLNSTLTAAAVRQMLDRAGIQHNIDADLLASVVHAESNGNPRAVSRAGAQGLMQLMPRTASNLGVQNTFAPEQNISGGTTYLDQMLIRYHDDIRLAVAAYNAGPAAVDRYHGIPPYAETRAYVARVVGEFNRRKRAARATQSATHAPLATTLFGAD